MESCGLGSCSVQGSERVAADPEANDQARVDAAGAANALRARDAQPLILALLVVVVLRPHQATSVAQASHLERRGSGRPARSAHGPAPRRHRRPWRHDRPTRPRTAAPYVVVRRTDAAAVARRPDERQPASATTPAGQASPHHLQRSRLMSVSRSPSPLSPSGRACV
jgi:hypothetical protein